ncbi:MAG: hypothetical protein R3A79_13315 [Nannocystaceae bacterium]
MPPLLPRPFRALALAAGLAFGALTLLSAPAAEAASAKPQGSFLSAQLPGEVENIDAVRDTLVGDIEHHTATAETDGAEMSITATELPGFVTTVTTDNMLYRKARRELLRNYSGTSKGWGRCSHAGYACRKLTYSTRDGREGIARLYLHDGVLVVVNAVYSEDDATAKRFLASVK